MEWISARELTLKTPKFRPLDCTQPTEASLVLCTKMIQSLDSSLYPDDTCAAWSKRLNEEATAKENLRQEVPTSAIREARERQAPQVTLDQGFCHARQ